VVAGPQGRPRFTLKDRSTTKGGPSKWGPAVIRAYEDYDADEIVGEVNQGGDLIRKVRDRRRGRPAGRRHRLQEGPGVEGQGPPRRAGGGRLRERQGFSTSAPSATRRPGPLYMLESQLCALHDGFDPTGEDFDRADANNYAHQRLARKRDDDSDVATWGGGISPSPNGGGGVTQRPSSNGRASRRSAGHRLGPRAGPWRASCPS
jgi:hypothetical protein